MKINCAKCLKIKLHYSPGIPIRLNVKKVRDEEAYILIRKKEVAKSNYYFLSKKGDLKEAAKNLYHYIFLADKNEKYKSISIGPIPKKGIGIAINDRLKKASK